MYRILIAQNNADEIEPLQKGFQQSGYETRLIRDGQEAYDFSRQSIPDLIITDVALTTKNGFEFCKSLKATAQLKDIPIIVLTTPQSNLEDSFRYLGIKEFVSRPINMAALVERVKALLHKAETLHVQKTKVLFYCSKTNIKEGTQKAFENMPQIALKVMESASMIPGQAREFLPDIVVMDLFMEGAHPDEVVAKIRKIPDLGRTPIITYYSPLPESGDPYIIQARMLGVQFLKDETARAGATEYLGPLSDPQQFIGLLKVYAKGLE